MSKSTKKLTSFAWQGWINTIVQVAAIGSIVYAATLSPDVSYSYSDRLAVFFFAIALYALAIVVIVLTKGTMLYWRQSDENP